MKVEYDVVERQDGTLAVIFGPKSEVSVDHVPAVVVKVSRDKNVTALNQRLAHIPEKRHGARGHFGALSAGGTSTLGTWLDDLLGPPSQGTQWRTCYGGGAG